MGDEVNLEANANFFVYNERDLESIFGKENSDSIKDLYFTPKRLDQSIKSLWKDCFVEAQQGHSIQKPLERIRFNLNILQEKFTKLHETLTQVVQKFPNDTQKVTTAIDIACRELPYLKRQIEINQTQLEEIDKPVPFKEQLHQMAKLPLQEREEKFAQIMASRYQLVNNLGQGNCGLHSIAKALYPQINLPTEIQFIANLRNDMIEYMRNNRNYFETFCKEDPRDYDKRVSFEEYLDIMSKFGTCISQQELSALSGLLQRPIYVYSAGGVSADKNGEIIPTSAFQYGNQFLKNGEPLRIYFGHCHYMTVGHKLSG